MKFRNLLSGEASLGVSDKLHSPRRMTPTKGLRERFPAGSQLRIVTRSAIPGSWRASSYTARQLPHQIQTFHIYFGPLVRKLPPIRCPNASARLAMPCLFRSSIWHRGLNGKQANPCCEMRAQAPAGTIAEMYRCGSKPVRRSRIEVSFR